MICKIKLNFLQFNKKAFCFQDQNVFQIVKTWERPIMRVKPVIWYVIMRVAPLFDICFSDAGVISVYGWHLNCCCRTVQETNLFRHRHFNPISTYGCVTFFSGSNLISEFQHFQRSSNSVCLIPAPIQTTRSTLIIMINHRLKLPKSSLQRILYSFGGNRNYDITIIQVNPKA